MGKSGLKLSELSLGSWVTFGAQLDLAGAKKLVKAAVDAGVNFLDTAESYGGGKAEELLGKILQDYKRENLVVSTKLFWGGEGPNDLGLNRKHLMEGFNNSLKRLDLDHVDILFCHRPDPNTPIEEVVTTMDIIVRSGRAFYWGTSEWSAVEIEAAHRAAAELHCIPPSVEQPQYSLFVRERVEKEYFSLYEKYGMGTTIWSPLNSGILTGKYNKGIPKGSRLATIDWLQKELTPEKVEKVKQLQSIADSLDCTLAQLAIAWCLRNHRVTTVILGASSVKQLQENLGALEFKEKLTPEVLAQIGKMV